MKKREYRGFEQDLEETFREYEGVHHEILRISPRFFRLFCTMLHDERVSWEARLFVDAALAYFVVPSDIIPEETFGELGYIDDVFLCAYVLNELDGMGLEPVIRDCWEGDDDIMEIVTSLLYKTRNLISARERDILEFVGLLGLKDTGF